MLRRMPPRLRLAPRPALVKTKTATATKDAATISVIVADDHAFMRRTLRLLLDSEQDVEVVAEADDLESVVRSVDGHHPQVLVLDLNLPGDSSLATIGRLRDRMPQTQIVVLTMHDDPGFAQRALDSGALGFVLKDLADSELVQAVRAAAHGEKYLSPRVVGRLATQRHALTPDKLSTREVEVLRLITLGHTSVEIAGRLDLSPRTVESHRARIHRKLGLATRAELVRYALGRGLLN
jgi:two-component system, NarL family, response regulator NreC